MPAMKTGRTVFIAVRIVTMIGCVTCAAAAARTPMATVTLTIIARNAATVLISVWIIAATVSVAKNVSAFAPTVNCVPIAARMALMTSVTVVDNAPIAPA